MMLTLLDVAINPRVILWVADIVDMLLGVTVSHRQIICLDVRSQVFSSNDWMIPISECYLCAFVLKWQVRILRSLFPPLLLDLYKLLVAPLQGGKVAAIMVARVTAITCQWLMGPCTVNSVDLPDGTSWNSGVSEFAVLFFHYSLLRSDNGCRNGWEGSPLMQVFVEKCKYLEESKCVGICLNTCKLPTQVGNSFFE